MKRFRFRLERVLEHRRTVRQEKQRVLMLEQRRVFELEEQLVMIEQALNKVMLGEETIHTVEEVQLVGSYAHRLRQDREQTLQEIQEAEKRVEQARAEYQEAAKDAEALEKLRDRKNKDYQKYLEQEELKFLDEQTIMRSSLGEKENR